MCGHVPVKAKDGEDPVKCDGHVLTIDGGFSKAYQPTTGIAGYTLISQLVRLRAGRARAFGIHPRCRAQRAGHPLVAPRGGAVGERTLVADTDTGAVLKQQIADLEELLAAYRRGTIAEREQ